MLKNQSESKPRAVIYFVCLFFFAFVLLIALLWSVGKKTAENCRLSHTITANGYISWLTESPFRSQNRFHSLCAAPDYIPYHCIPNMAIKDR